MYLGAVPGAGPHVGGAVVEHHELAGDERRVGHQQPPPPTLDRRVPAGREQKRMKTGLECLVSWRVMNAELGTSSRRRRL